MAQQRFHKGQVIPLAAGWFGEIGKEFEAVINRIKGKVAYMQPLK